MPYSEEIAGMVIPRDFKMPQMEVCDGIGDPHAHLAIFDMHMYIYGATDAMKCILFGGTLKMTALMWYTSLPAQLIHNYDELSSMFLAQFTNSKAKRFTAVDMHDIEQGSEETLKAYLA